MIYRTESWLKSKKCDLKKHKYDLKNINMNTRLILNQPYFWLNRYSDVNEDLVETRIKAVLSWLSTQPEPAMIVRTQLVDAYLAVTSHRQNTVNKKSWTENLRGDMRTLKEWVLKLL